MAWYFRKRVRIFKGVNLNLSKSGMSLSVGPRGAKLNLSKKGASLYTSIPGTGIYSRTQLVGCKRSKRKYSSEPTNEVQVTNPLAVFILLFSFLLAIVIPIFSSLAWWWFFVILFVGFLISVFISNSEQKRMAIEQEKAEAQNKRLIEEERERQALKESENENFILAHYRENGFDDVFTSVAIYSVRYKHYSTSEVVRKFCLGYAQAGKITEELVKVGIISQCTGSRPHIVLCKNMEELRNILIDKTNISN